MKKVVPSNAILIPNSATCVFRGEIFDVYQWPRQLFDGTTVTYEMLRRADSMHIIAIKDDKIIAIDEQQPGRPAFFRLPGGRVEPNESWLDAAKRECSEELGMEFARWRLVAVTQPMTKVECFAATFIATNFVAQHAQNLDAGEKLAVHELTFGEWKQRLAAESGPLLDPAKPFFSSIASLEQLLDVPEFQGKVIDRL